MTPSAKTSFSAALQALLGEPRLNPLDAGEPNRAAHAALLALDDALFAPHQVVDHDMAAACRAGLWLYHNYLDETHTLSQEIATPEGSYWHAIMHRREPDAANAAYWFRRVGQHSVFETLAREAQALGLSLNAARWNPVAFIELCEQQRGKGSELELLLRRVQQREWELLFDWCYRRASDKE